MLGHETYVTALTPAEHVYSCIPHRGGGPMSRYPRTVRDSAIKCIGCNAPVARTVDDRYVCVECGESPIRNGH